MICWSNLFVRVKLSINDSAERTLHIPQYSTHISKGFDSIFINTSRPISQKGYLEYMRRRKRLKDKKYVLDKTRHPAILNVFSFPLKLIPADFR